MPFKQGINIEIDKLTRSIENVISGDSFKTEVLEVTSKDIKSFQSREWLFNWKEEFKNAQKTVYKLVTAENQMIIQGLVSVQDKNDHIYMHLIESSKFNKGAKKVYLGVPGNLVAFVCNLSFQKGYGGFVSFESKTKLMAHYQKTLGAHILFGNVMALDNRAAMKLIKQYYPDIS